MPKTPNQFQRGLAHLGTSFSNILNSFNKGNKGRESPIGKLATQSKQLVQSYSPAVQQRANTMIQSMSRVATDTQNWMGEEQDISPISDDINVVPPPVPQANPVDVSLALYVNPTILRAMSPIATAPPLEMTDA